jgi:hypothetical protein
MSTHKRTSVRRAGHKLNKGQTEEAQDKFLKAFANNGNVRAACLIAGVDRSTIHAWAEHFEEFNFSYNLAKEDVNDAIRGEIFRRGMFGEERFITSMGNVVYHEGKPLTIKEKSDTLLMFHARARMPEYREKQQIDLNAQITTMAESAKDELLADLAAAIANEDKEQTSQG